MMKKKTEYDHKEIESRWQKRWEKEGIYQPDIHKVRKPFYNLMMFPYPSAEGLHVGNMYAFTGADVYGRFQRMRGYDVFQPIGLDGFGIHSENYAIKIGKHPAEQAKVSQKRYYEQLHRIGNGFSWKNRLETYDPDYYRWTQWIFIQMFKRGLAYKKPSTVNWCPSCKTVLADEQVEGGICERCKNVVEKREMAQWFFKITDFAQRLLDNIEKIDWPEKIKIAQRRWIGRKEGININYKVQIPPQNFVAGQANSKREVVVTCFTTRPDTNFGATFVVLGPEHSLLASNQHLKLPVSVWKKVQRYIEKSVKKSEIERLTEGKKKTGVFLDRYCINDLNGYRMPMYISDFVLGHVGTGAVVGVPGHDKRDFEFAQEFDLPVPRVVVGSDRDKSPITGIEQVQEEEGVMVNSDFLNGMNIHKATQKIMDYMEDKGQGKRVVEYRLRDWCISRQRYWGPPIPMVECKKCGWQAVPEEDLPVELPHIDDWMPTGDGKSPLEKASREWLYTKCPECGGKAKRETDVSDTFLDSAWYFLRYPSTRSAHSGQVPFDKVITKRWLPVDAYIGGAEHAVLHLLYSRFIWMCLYDWGYFNFSAQGGPALGWEEPFPFLYSHGLIIKDGAKMSKSRGNVVVPDEYINKYGSDTLRTYLMFIGRYDLGGDFKDSGIAGMKKFLNRVWRLYQKDVILRLPGSSHRSRRAQDDKAALKSLAALSSTKSDDNLVRSLHRTIKKVTGDIGKFKYNTAIAAMMEFVNEWEQALQQSTNNTQQTTLNASDSIKFLKLLAPFAPYMSEEIYQSLLKLKVKNEKLKVFNSIHTQRWPEWDEKLVKLEEIVIPVQVNGKLRGTVVVSSDEAKDKDGVIKLAKKQERVAKYLRGNKIKKTIWVPGRLVNFVIRR